MERDRTSSESSGEEISVELKQLLSHLESIVADKCFNGNIQNWGPHGVWEGSGRWFRYPLRYFSVWGYEMDGRWGYLPENISDFNSAHYAFGANKLFIMRALMEILGYLEENYGLKFEESKEKPTISNSADAE